MKLHRYRSLFAALYLIEEIVLLTIMYFGLLLYYQLNFNFTNKLILVLIILGYLLGFSLVRVNYNDVKQLHVPHLIRRYFLKMAIAASVLIICSYVLGFSVSIHRKFLFVFLCTSFFVMIFSHWITRKFLTFTVKRTIKKGVILGAGLVGIKMYEEMLRNVYNGVIILGFFDDNPKINRKDVLGNIESAKKFIIKYKVTHIFCALPATADKTIKDFIKFSDSHVINFHIVPSIGYYYEGGRAFVEQIGQMPVFSLRNVPLSYLHNAVLKRAFDMIVSLILVVSIFPLLYVVLAPVIRLTSPGPALFIQKRTGNRGKVFDCYKFRTMRKNDANSQATIDDNRKTRIGNILRRTSIDELPQLINVLRGDMSLVGPRPHPLFLTDEYIFKIDKYMVRHFIKPGITGYAQINGYRGETQEIEMMEKRVRADLHYVENWTFGFDLYIIFKTVLLMVKGDKNAY